MAIVKHKLQVSIFLYLVFSVLVTFVQQTLYEKNEARSRLHVELNSCTEISFKQVFILHVLKGYTRTMVHVSQIS